MQSHDSDITQLLQAWGEGDRQALEDIVESVYPRLRQIAGAIMRREQPGTLQATALVNELYLKLTQQHSASFQNREHFFAVVAKLMRFIVINLANQRRALKRGGEKIALSEEVPWLDGSPDLHLALDRLAEEDERLAKVFEIRVFLGCTASETADLIGISKATVDRDFTLAKTWLFRQLYSGNTVSG